jgi:hypothetical protein
VTPPVRLAPGESRDPVDPSRVASSVYRGNVMELVRIGHPWVAVVEGASLIVMVVLVIAGQPWPAILAAALAIAVAIWARRRLKRWSAAHNDRVVLALDSEVSSH